MKALICKEIAPAEKLTIGYMDVPTPKEDEILVEVKAVGVNFRDSLIIEDKYQFKARRPFAPGGEISGIIRAIGTNVTGFEKGERVFCEIGHGGMAEFAVAKANSTYKMPNDMDFETAAAIMINYGTALYGIQNRGRAKAGERLLVLGASGGTGIAAVEIGKALGLHVIAAVSSQEKLDFAIKMGADEGFIYPYGPFDDDTKKDLAKMFKEKMPNKPDIVFDILGGEYSEAAIRAINWGGRHLVVGFTAGIPKIPMNLMLLKSCELSGVFFSEYTKKERDNFIKDINMLCELVSKQKLKPQISEVFSLEQGAQAILHLKNRKVQGKAIVKI